MEVISFIQQLLSIELALSITVNLGKEGIMTALKSPHLPQVSERYNTEEDTEFPCELPTEMIFLIQYTHGRIMYEISVFSSKISPSVLHGEFIIKYIRNTPMEIRTAIGRLPNLFYLDF